MKYGLLILTFCFSILGSAQVKFFKYYTNNGNDFGEGITQLADSSYLITGASSSFQDAPADAFILKISKTGDYIWSKNYGGTESDRGRRIFHVPNDGIYVFGFTNSIGAGSFDFYFFKTDESGELIWSNTHGSSKFEKLNDVVMLADTSFILVGETTNTANEQEDFLMTRLNKTGGIIWSQTWGADGIDIAKAVTNLNDTTVIVVGSSYYADSLTQKGVVLKMHIDGTIQIEKYLGNSGEYGLNTVFIHNNRLKMGGHHIPYGYDRRLYCFIQTSLDGEQLDEYSQDKVGSYYIEHMVPYGDSTFCYVSMQCSETDVPSFPGGEDINIFGFYTALYYNGPSVAPSSYGQDQANQMIRTSDGGAVMVGYNSDSGLGGNNVIVYKIGPNEDAPITTGLPNLENLVHISSKQLDWGKIYPNPTTGKLMVEVNSSDELLIEVYSIAGKKVLSTSDLGSQWIDLSTFDAGMYQLRLTQAGKSSTVSVVKF